MDIKEKEYLAKTLKVLNKKIEENDNKTQEMTKQLNGGIKQISEDYSDLSRGGDLSDAYSSLAEVESLEHEIYRENKRLHIQKNSPYFARIDFAPNGKKTVQKVYIGIGNIIDNEKLYVADWRAPISSLYYDYNLGDASFFIGKDEFKGKLELKRQYKIEDGQLLSYFDTDLTINDEILQDILSHNVSVKMKQIVSSIQKEQNTIVRNDKNENMLVQGVAGSGKTSIALHRAAYLLYKQ